MYMASQEITFDEGRFAWLYFQFSRLILVILSVFSIDFGDNQHFYIFQMYEMIL